jgi:hypothetical protein
MQPEADAIKGGVPETALKALTGEFTPPGKNLQAFLKSSSDRVIYPSE